MVVATCSIANSRPMVIIVVAKTGWPTMRRRITASTAIPSSAIITMATSSAT